ncbi:uncharacterized protein BDZ83DRAFT_777440 [Colletotrichum acutatum]|uniref:Uncharacterized protein n=1 Tax=Glomerella acutata TaxID=27357 RepID=A0AAD8XFE5_GLOAC|nr:uncharacterized protein BDZ83DRAFT_777440 [Colletotrichum acutatum]KAK1725292.1 hypothetical protein BDZ83DRAFT_777440 [Colletotrichum acutatum]
MRKLLIGTTGYAQKKLSWLAKSSTKADVTVQFASQLASSKRDKTSSGLVNMLQAPRSNGKSGLFSRFGEASRGKRYQLFRAAAFLSLGMQATVIYGQVTSDVYKWMKGDILVGLFLIHNSAWVLCTNNAQVDYYHNEVVFDACPQNHPTQISVSCNNRKTWQKKWLKKVAQGAVILYATFNSICIWEAWITLAVFFTGASKKTESGWNWARHLPLPLSYRSW